VKYLPVIVGFGGYNTAGRSSFHHAFKRCIFESLNQQQAQNTIANLAAMMKTPANDSQTVLNGTLIRTIEANHFDPNNVYWQQKTNLQLDNPISFTLSNKELPKPLPNNWRITQLDDSTATITITEQMQVLLPSTRDLPVKVAGQLPTGFNPAELYNARFHPRGLQMAIVAASDAVHSMGIDWSVITQTVSPEQIAVFAGSAMSQLDEQGFGNLLQARLKGTRVTAKNCPLGLSTMPADFINAYVLGNLGNTGSVTGACATFLYNLQKACEQINNGITKIAIVGNSEAPITPEIIEGYSAMNALASVDGLNRIGADARTASRPFGENCGFTIAESAQYLILMADDLALELGADIHGAVSDIFINADGFKKSISAPGAGNYLTMARATAAAINLFGINTIQHHSFVHSHGSSTPANRVTESKLLNDVAKAFAIDKWPVVAIKAYLGHSLAAASGDQVMSALGSFAYGILPGIKTISHLADDVIREHLSFALQDQEHQVDVSFINAKGFGGNNATGVIVSPNLTRQMLSNRYGLRSITAYDHKREKTKTKALAYDAKAQQGDFDVIYNFGQNMLDDADINISNRQITIKGIKSLVFSDKHKFKDMC